MKRNAKDAKFSKEMRVKWEFRCQRCGTQHVENSMGLHCCHIFSRAIKRTRHDPENILVCCNGCHRHIDSYPEEKERLARSVLGDERYEALRLRAHTPLKRVSP